MILQNLTRAIRRQNWFLAGVEFFIVIVGVALGFQVTLWNDTSIERRTAEGRIQLVIQEMTVNQQRILEFQEWNRNLLDQMSDLFDVVSQESQPESNEQLAELLASPMYIDRITLKRSAIDDLSVAPELARFLPDEIWSLIGAWDDEVEIFESQINEAISFRNQLTYPTYAQQFRFSTIVPGDHRNRENLPRQVIGNVYLENVITIQMMLLAESQVRIEDLRRANQNLLSALEEFYPGAS